MNLMAASRQWATRPPDQRFRNLGALLKATTDHFNNSYEDDVITSKVQVESVPTADGGDIVLHTPRNQNINFSWHSFGQFCTLLGLPAAPFRDIKSQHSVPIFQDRLNAFGNVLKSKLYLRREVAEDGNVNNQLLAFTSEEYGRIYNKEVAEQLINLGSNWKTPPARPVADGYPGNRIATQEDCAGINTRVRPGDRIADAGIYASAHDMFVFLVDTNTRIDDGSDGGLQRGFYVQNSEVGRCAFKLTAFMLREICGNQIIWGCENIFHISIRHMGRQAREKAFRELRERVQKYRIGSGEPMRVKVQQARHFELADRKETLVDLVFRKKGFLGKKDAEAAFDMAEQFASVDGAPTTAWGFAGGITRLSQQKMFADERNELDVAAGKVLDLVPA
jgi:hypothetical protein